MHAMAKTIRFFVMFLTSGVVWFFLFSIPTHNEKFFFIEIHNWMLSIEHPHTEKEKGSKKIDREKVIDAMKNAF
jgi:uncharacterized protein involved in cysteine biosynthesis